MEKDMTLACEHRSMTTFTAFAGIATRALALAANGVLKNVRNGVDWLRRYYSKALDRELSMRQTWLLVNAQAAFFFTFLPAEAPWVFRAVGALWLWKVIAACKKTL